MAGNEAVNAAVGIAAQAALGVATGGIAPAVTALAPAVADIAKALPNPMDALGGGSSSATSGDIKGDTTNNQSFGGINIGTDALFSPAAQVASYQQRRYGAPPPTAAEAGLTYTSTVSASQTGVYVVGGVAALALLFLALKKGK